MEYLVGVWRELLLSLHIMNQMVIYWMASPPRCSDASARFLEYVNDERKTVLVKPYNCGFKLGFYCKPEVYLSFDANA